MSFTTRWNQWMTYNGSPDNRLFELQPYYIKDKYPATLSPTILSANPTLTVFPAAMVLLPSAAASVGHWVRSLVVRGSAVSLDRGFMVPPTVSSVGTAYTLVLLTWAYIVGGRRDGLPLSHNTFVLSLAGNLTLEIQTFVSTRWNRWLIL